MFEKLKSFINQGKSMLEDALEVPEEDDFVTVPEGVTEEQLIEEARQYVDAIIVTHHKTKDSPAVFLKTGAADEVKADSEAESLEPEKAEDPAPESSTKDTEPDSEKTEGSTEAEE